jgi:hypothetical protein
MGQKMYAEAKRGTFSKLSFQKELGTNSFQVGIDFYTQW